MIGVEQSVNRPGTWRICAIVVWFQPSPEAVENVLRLCREVERVVLVDNGSTPARWEAVAASMPRESVHRIANPSNRGLAAALNQGLEYAQLGGFSWAATFDQDSIPAGDYFAEMRAALHGVDDLDRVGIVAPRYQVPALGWEIEQPHAGPGPWLATTMTSGNLLRLTMLQSVGRFREDFFIDCVDHEFCLRCRQHGFRILQSGAILHHALGRARRARLLWMRPLVTDHSPERRFYMARNRLRLYREYATRETQWVLADARAFLRELVLVGLCEDERWRKLAASVRGCWHGLRGVFGKELPNP